ncbi:MAG: ArsA-related P-loop ATPase [Candidatus Pacebacteria bacterium]|nr:ArsA-related P-loop ATPase [Candidatus Paceibacterota bacterium]
MRISVYAGKGGVGKTTIAVSLAVHLARMGEKTLVIDYDGGHSVTNTLGVSQIKPNRIHNVLPNLDVLVVENTNFINIGASKKQKMSLKSYLGQFLKHLGIVPFADMLFEFFGVPTDVTSAEKFALLVRAMSSLRSGQYDHVIIDVEPTAGLERLLSNTESMARSLIRLQGKGIVFLKAVSAMGWSDIAGYLQGDFIRNVHVYAADMKVVAAELKKARYFLVCVPEKSPVSQTFLVRGIIESFGARVYGCIVNRVREEKHEDGNIALLADHRLPTLKVKQAWSLHLASDPQEMLDAIGSDLVKEFGK